ncbi:MAG: hypothetical protein JW820_07845 [Spirochaetales bacterium]|nr:hypothetical protein [Spirochaetales bacterium]
MLKLLEYLQDLFLTLLGKNPQELERRRRLRAVNEELRRLKPNFYRRGSRQVLPDFASAVLELLNCVRPLRELFDRTVCVEDAKLAQRYRDYLIVARLPVHLQELYASFVFGNLRSRILAAADSEAELARVEQELSSFLGNLSDPEYYSFDADYTAMQRLISLCQHSYTHLLSLFDPEYDPTNRAAPPKFRPVAADEVLTELLDLYFLIGGIDLSEGLGRNLDYLVERLSREGAAEAKQRTGKVLVRLRALLQQHLSPAILLALIRSIRQEPQYSPELMSEQFYYLDEFRGRFQEYFGRLRERIQWELRESAVQEDLRRLFHGAELLEIEGYEEGLARSLQEMDYDCFASVKPLRILKSFVVGHFMRTLRDPLKRLIVEGKFENRIFQNMFTNTFFGCEALAQKIQQLEENLTNTGALSVQKLRHFLAMYKEGKPVHNIVGKLCDGIESGLRNLLDEGANLFYNLCVLLLDVLRDAKQKTPEHVANINALAGGGNEQYLASLSSGYESLYLFVKIIKNFAKVRQLETEAS